MRRIAVLDAPSNLGLRPPSPGTSPGCAKAPGALRDHALVARLRAADAGCVTAPRYDPEDWRPEDGVCQAEEIAEYSELLARRVGALIDRGDLPLVLGGDCSILLGSALAMRRRRAQRGGRHGLVFIDGHSDFRHAGNAEYVGAAAGEDLALVTGRGQGNLTNVDGLRPYFWEEDVVVLGIRDTDEYRMDLKAAGVVFRTVPQIRAEGARRSAAWAYEELGRVEGFWVHVDVDVLDPAAMPAVDAPDPGGIAFVELEQMIADLVARPTCLGVEVTVFDPDYDPDGRYAGQIVDTLVGGLRPIWEHSQRPLDGYLDQTDPPDPEPESGSEAGSETLSELWPAPEPEADKPEADNEPLPDDPRADNESLPDEPQPKEPQPKEPQPKEPQPEEPAVDRETAAGGQPAADGEPGPDSESRPDLEPVGRQGRGARPGRQGRQTPRPG